MAREQLDLVFWALFKQTGRCPRLLQPHRMHWTHPGAAVASLYFTNTTSSTVPCAAVQQQLQTSAALQQLQHAIHNTNPYHPPEAVDAVVHLEGRLTLGPAAAGSRCTRGVQRSPFIRCQRYTCKFIWLDSAAQQRSWHMSRICKASADGCSVKKRMRAVHGCRHPPAAFEGFSVWPLDFGGAHCKLLVAASRNHLAAS